MADDCLLVKTSLYVATIVKRISVQSQRSHIIFNCDCFLCVRTWICKSYRNCEHSYSPCPINNKVMESLNWLDAAFSFIWLNLTLVVKDLQIRGNQSVGRSIIITAVETPGVPAVSLPITAMGAEEGGGLFLYSLGLKSLIVEEKKPGGGFSLSINWGVLLEKATCLIKIGFLFEKGLKLW